MQILHRFAGSIHRYSDELSDPDRYRADHCPQCEADRPLTAHGFYTRTLVDIATDGTIRVRRYLCRCCKRTVSLLPEFALPYLRFGIVVVALFLVARILLGLTLNAAAEATKLPVASYQRGQFWVRRCRQQAEKLGERDTLGQTVEFTAGGLPLRLEYRRIGGPVSGRVEEGGGVAVILRPQGLDAPELLMTALCDPNGAFQTGVTRPGRYQVWAFDGSLGDAGVPPRAGTACVERRC